ncbi:hypothetical protein HY637_02480 [Candidatus Woesearchaeota archaeon]|nr:hypothetical protein [Candidatus Woesearchaeota archaeon]
MTEKKQVLYDLRIAYNSPFLIEDFYAEIDGWIKEKGFTKEHKKKMESVTNNGKRIQWFIEIQGHLDDLHHGIIMLRVFMENIKEIVIKKDGKKTRINIGDVLVNIDAFVVSEIHGSFYQAKPIFYFIRALIDKYIYNFWSFKWDGKVNSDGRDLYKRLQSFFNVQKYKYE